MAPRPATISADVQEQILDAALARFRTYGYGKTTMAEIAEDTGMSAANLYRYFQSKQDIAAACASRCTDERLGVLRKAVADADVGVAERLERFVQAMLRYTYEQTQNNNNVNELVEVVAQTHSELIHAKVKAEQAIIAQILAEGHASGEFDVPDVITTAGTVHNALVIFGMPIFMRLHRLETFERMATDSVRLLIQGLATR